MNLLDEHTADLDTKDNPNWGMQIHRDAEYDIELWHGVLIGNQDNTEFAVVTGPRKYHTCKTATPYVGEPSKATTKEGVTACVRTSDSRYAYVEIKRFSHNPDIIQLAVVVWDPPFK